ncbi:MAG: PEP-CTERM sorting domain-containing protein [candidate division Zixibacteria bacterium]|nr:PEP-CTERM sorting domain-containing protein [candidate division Zixibacteria bacterium]
MKKLARLSLQSAVLLFVCSGVYAQVGIMNLVQWEVANGGNDHWYAVMAEDAYWHDAYSMSRTVEQAGQFGYLATITSQAENDFIFNSVTSGVTNPSILDEYYLGGYWDDDWSWITGEDFSYTNWAPGEPNNWASDGGNNEPAIAMWGHGTTHSLRVPGMWNNEEADAFTFWSIVEWGGSTTDLPTTAPFSPSPLTVVPEPSTLLLLGLGLVGARIIKRL